MVGAALSLSADGTEDDASASEAFDTVAEKNSQNSQVIKRLGQEFEQVGELDQLRAMRVWTHGG